MLAMSKGAVLCMTTSFFITDAVQYLLYHPKRLKCHSYININSHSSTNPGRYLLKNKIAENHYSLLIIDY